MRGRVIQGFFPGGARLAPPTVPAGVAAAAVQRRAATPPVAAPGRPALFNAGPAAAPLQRRAAAVPPTPGRPPLVHGGTAAPVQRHVAPGRPPLVHGGSAGAAATGPARPLQRFGGDGSFAVDPAQVGLVRSGGRPLPGALLAKMEGAFGADFSAVRIHVGPQASRIGALAFTTGNDVYFAPGQYQPDSVKGQQLIGHELAHVIQQRQGRVGAPGGGVAVVQDRALEAEADRLGMRAASFYFGAKTASSSMVVQRVVMNAIQRMEESFDESFDDESCQLNDSTCSNASSMSIWSNKSLSPASIAKVFASSTKNSRQPQIYEDEKEDIRSLNFHSSDGLANLVPLAYGRKKNASANTHALLSMSVRSKLYKGKKIRAMVNSTTANSMNAVAARHGAVNIGSVSNFFKGKHVHTEMFIIFILTQGDESKIAGCMKDLKLVVDKPICAQCIEYVRKAKPHAVDDGTNYNDINTDKTRKKFKSWGDPFALHKQKPVNIPSNVFAASE